METSELLKKVRRIEIKTRGLSRNIFAGQYHSAFKGRGMAFSEVIETYPPATSALMSRCSRRSVS